MIGYVATPALSEVPPPTGAAPPAEPGAFQAQLVEAQTATGPEADVAPGAAPAPASEAAPDTATTDGTRAAQDLVASTLRAFIAAPAPTPVASAAPAIEQPIAAATAPQLSMEAAIHRLLDQMQAVPPEPFTLDDDEIAPVELDGLATDALPLPDAPRVEAKPVDAPKGPAATVAVRDPAPLPENANPSHVHLVLDEIGDRPVVVTVAVRGNEVAATVRGDEQTAAALARNAGSLDHAMRARGLDLTSFTAERDLDQHPREHAREQREKREQPSEPFRLEEIV